MSRRQQTLEEKRQFYWNKRDYYLGKQYDKRHGDIEKKKKYLLVDAKKRAKDFGLPFDITVDDLEWPEFCPILGIPLNYLAGNVSREYAASLDKVVPELGYVKGNVCVISMKANRLKSNATIEELRKLLEYMEFSVRSAGKRFGILNVVQAEKPLVEAQATETNWVAANDNEGTACYIDPVSGRKTCE